MHHLFATGRAGSRDLLARLSKLLLTQAPLDKKSPLSRRAQSKWGQAMVEFAFIGPLLFLLLLGIVVGGITIGNQNLLNNGVRDAARAAAICGGSARDSLTQLPATGSQTQQPCSWANLDLYAKARLSQLAGPAGLGAPAAPIGSDNCKTLPSGSALVCLFDGSNTAVAVTSNLHPLDSCKLGYKIEISSEYAEPLYLPLVGKFLGSNGSTTTRTLTADAEATCEQ